MACERYEDALKQLAAGAAPTVEPPRLGAPRVEPELESHLAGCARCREELDTLRRTLALVDSELRQLVAADPSPELAVRIRRAAAQAPVGRRPAWLWPALAAAAVLLLAFVLLTPRETPPSAVATIESRVPAIPTTPEPPRGIPFAPEGPRVGAARPVPRDHARAAESRRPVAPSEPEIIVPRGEAEALLRLVARLDRDKLAPPVLASVDRPSPELAELRSIDITPLEIVPLDPAESSGT
jgi:hypothetical protein